MVKGQQDMKREKSKSKSVPTCPHNCVDTMEVGGSHSWSATLNNAFPPQTENKCNRLDIGTDARLKSNQLMVTCTSFCSPLQT